MPDDAAVAALLERCARPARGPALRGAAGAPGRATVERGARGDRDRPVVPRPDRCCIDEVAARGARGRRRSTPELLRLAKRHGFSDAQLGELREHAARTSSAACGTRWASGRSTRRSTPAPPSSPRSTPYHYSSATTRRTRSRRATQPQGDHPRVAGRTGSARASSSTTPACTPRSRCGTPASRPSWSTATPRPSRPTTTPPTGCTSSRSPSRTCSRSCHAEQRRPGRSSA